MLFDVVEGLVEVEGAEIDGIAAGEAHLAVGMDVGLSFGVEEHAVHEAGMAYVVVGDVAENLVKVTGVDCRFVEMHLKRLAVIFRVDDESAVTFMQEYICFHRR